MDFCHIMVYNDKYIICDCGVRVMDKKIKILNENKISPIIYTGSKIPPNAFSKSSNKGNAPKPSDIQNMIQKINKKEGK